MQRVRLISKEVASHFHSLSAPDRPHRLMVSEVGNDVLLFDEASNHLHHLERDAAAVWQRADGTRTVAMLAGELGMTAEEVDGVLIRLSDGHLLQSPWASSHHPSRVDRRRMLKRAGLAAGVVSISAPLAAQAQSVTPDGSCWLLACYPVGCDWAAVPYDYATCKVLDACNPGGGGASGDQCYKWTIGPDDDFGGWV